MLDEFLQHTLAEVDDLTELKVSLVALRLLELKQSETASITARELAAHPALSNGLGFAPEIALNAALQRAVARGTLLASTIAVLDELRYFQNNDASRRMLEAIELADNTRSSTHSTGPERSVRRALSVIAREIEWLESIDVYAPTPHDEEAVEEWLAQGYTQDEILRGIRETLNKPRVKGTPSRTLQACTRHIKSKPPALESAYYRAVVARSLQPPDEIIAFRELARRWPNGHEFNLIRAAVGIFSSNATIEAMKRLVSAEQAKVNDLLPLLAEREEAELALARDEVLPDLKLRRIIELYESTFGLPPTSRIAQDMLELADEVKDMEVWQSVFKYAATQNKREWNYVRKLLLNPSPSIFEPEPVNDTARFAFSLYKRRVSRGVLDPAVAREINEVAQNVTDESKWNDAIDRAAKANALRWDYIRKILITPNKDTGSEVKDGRRKQGSGTRQRGVGRRPQVDEPTEEELKAARERARKYIEEHTRRSSKPGGKDDVTNR
ncbi:MAG TPA: DnaD domain protein [Anaerolineae bacterium]